MKTLRACSLVAMLFLIPGAGAAQATLTFEKSPYGLLFTEISVNDRLITAMIDFGDPYSLQLASSFISAHGLSAEPSGRQFQYADGTGFDALEGVVDKVVIGGIELESLTFGSAPGEIDAVAEQVGTAFHAVIGWGFFGSRAFMLDYAAGSIDLDIQACPEHSDAVVSRRHAASHLITDGRIGGRYIGVLIDTGYPVNVLDRHAFEAAGKPGAATPIDHAAGHVDGQRLNVALDDWESVQDFDVTDLDALKPLGVEAVLGGSFLEAVRMCHDPVNERLHFSIR